MTFRSESFQCLHQNAPLVPPPEGASNAATLLDLFPLVGRNKRWGSASYRGAVPRFDPHPRSLPHKGEGSLTRLRTLLLLRQKLLLGLGHVVRPLLGHVLRR